MKTIKELEEEDHFLEEVSLDELNADFRRRERSFVEGRRKIWQEFLGNPVGLRFYYYESNAERDQGFWSSGYIAADPTGNVVRSLTTRIG